MANKKPGIPTWDDEPIEHLGTAEPFSLPSAIGFSDKPIHDVVAVEPTDASGLLTPEEIIAIKAEVEASSLAKKKKDARKLLMEKYLNAELATTEPKREKVSISINTPHFAAIDPASSGIRIDGTPYLQGRTYTVSRGKADMLRETMQRAWGHEEITFGHKDPNAYRRPRNENQHGQPVSNGLLRF